MCEHCQRTRFEDLGELELVDASDDLDVLEGEEYDLDVLEGEEAYDLDVWEGDEYLDEEADWDEDVAELEEVLHGSLHEDYADALPEEVEAALYNIFDSMSAAEAFSLRKALRQIKKGTSKALRGPLGQVVKTGLPIAGGAAGTLLGGPAGTAVGSALGSAAAKALPSPSKASAPARPSRMAVSPLRPTFPAATAPISTGSTAAAQGLVLTQQPEVLQSLLALALGTEGRRSIDGVPVGAVMNLLSSVFAQAAGDADELRYWDEESSGYLYDSEVYPDGDPAAPADRARALYAHLLDSENRRLAETSAH